MAERETLWGWDLDESPADHGEGDYSNGHREPITEPIPVIETEHELPAETADDTTGYPEEIGRAFTYAGPFIDRRPGSPASALTFRPPPQPWFRTKRGLVILLAVVAVAIVLSIIPLVLRSPGPGAEESTNVTPTSAEPAPSSAPSVSDTVRPTLTGRPAPPPPPPPPPPQDDAPVYTRQYPAPRGGSSSEPAKPDIGVTRAPISVAPEPRRPPPNDADVGDHGGGGFW
jgi:hypothetical protein